MSDSQRFRRKPALAAPGPPARSAPANPSGPFAELIREQSWEPSWGAPPEPSSPRYPVSLMAVLPMGDYHRVSFVTWVAAETLGIDGLPSFATRPGSATDLELRLPDIWNVPSLRLRVTPLWASPRQAVLRASGADPMEQRRYAQLVEAASRGALLAVTDSARQRPAIAMPTITERRDHSRYAVRGLGVRLSPGGTLLQVVDVGEGGFSVRAKLAEGPPQVFELVGDARWANRSLWVTGQVVRGAKVSAVHALAPNYDQFLALVHHARKQRK